MPRYYYYYYGGIDRSKGRINRPLDLWTDSIKFWLTRLLLPMITDRNIYIYIYILLSVDRYIVWQFYHGMYIYISTSSDISRFHWISKPISHRIYGTTLQSHSFFPPPLHSFRKLKSIELLSLWSFFWKEPLPVSPVFRVERNSNLPDNFSDPI